MVNTFEKSEFSFRTSDTGRAHTTMQQQPIERSTEYIFIALCRSDWPPWRFRCFYFHLYGRHYETALVFQLRDGGGGSGGSGVLVAAMLAVKYRCSYIHRSRNSTRLWRVFQFRWNSTENVTLFIVAYSSYDDIKTESTTRRKENKIKNCVSICCFTLSAENGQHRNEMIVW